MNQLSCFSTSISLNIFDRALSKMKSTGGNLEPMPFVRKWGAAVDGENGAEGSQLPTEQCDDNDAARAIASSGKHRNRSRSKSPSSKKHKKRSSRSPERKKHKKRSRSRESKHRKRDRSRESKRTKDRDEPQQQQNISAFPPPSDYLQQVQQRHQQEMQHLQKPTPIPLMQLQFKQETDYGGMEQQQSYGQLYQQDFQQPQQNARQSILLPQQSQHELEQQEPEKKNDALSAALAAAAMVAQKLGKGGFTPGGGGGGGSGGALGSSADLLNRIPQTPQRATPISETVLAKEPVKNEPEQTLTEEQRQREQRRKSRWSTTKAFVPGMPTILPSDIDENQRQVYLFQMEIEETTRRLRQSDFGQNVDPAERSPSPEPVYDTTGKRLNTREVRKRQEIEQRRHEKIQALLRLNPNYKPPADYRPPNIKLHDKVWIPQEEHPEINFVGLLIGPRGNTLKALEAETGAKIIIRGKGSIKEGKLANRTGPLPGENEPLHAYVTSTDREAIKRGCDKIREIINAALMIPDGQNELRKLQLRELALLNGTLRPEDVLSGARCTNCGSDQHKTWECMEAPNVTANVICTACGGAGHIARDCKNPRPGFDGAMMDAEYSALMAELGEKPPISLEAGTAPPLVGGKPIPGFPGSGPRPRFALPAPTPIVRVNLAKQQNPHHQQPIGGGGGYPGWDGSNFYGFSGLPGQDPAAAAAAWAAWQAGQSGFPAPVPPPPGGGFGPGGVDSSLTAGTSAGGLAMFPPPPPPPPPAPKHEIKEEFDSILSAPAPPPPPT